MSWTQSVLELAPRVRGFHIITDEVQGALAEMPPVKAGLLHLFLQHTSASLSINENADADVPRDLEDSFSTLAPENAPYRHTCEGPDDMPAHVKAMLTGVSLHVPVAGGKLALGTWQGIYLIEHRARPHTREVILQFVGSRKDS